MKLAAPSQPPPSAATLAEQALERLEAAQDSLLGLGNFSECFGGALPGAGGGGTTPWGVKAAQGQRPNMEDAYSVQLAQPPVVLPAPGTSPSGSQGIGAPQQQALATGHPPPGADCGPDADSGNSSTSNSSSTDRSLAGDSSGGGAQASDAEAPLCPWAEDLAVLSVFDGHGGQEVAMHCRDRLHRHFADHLSAHRVEPGSGDAAAPRACGALPTDSASLLSHNPGAVGEALRAAFLKTDQELAGTEAGDYVGATAVVAVIGRSHIWIAHAGDSRAVIQRAGDAHALTRDHKPDREDEAARIKAMGGRIVYTSGSSRVMGMLAMSRAIGDHFLRPYVIADPEIACLERTPTDEVLVLATDGLWDVFSCKEATNLAQRCIHRSKERGMSRHGACRVAASVLTKVALERGSRDNITVIVVDVTLPVGGSGHPSGPNPAAPHGGTSGINSGAHAQLHHHHHHPPLRQHTSEGSGLARRSASVTLPVKAGPGELGEGEEGKEPCAHSVVVTQQQPTEQPQGGTVGGPAAQVGGPSRATSASNATLSGLTQPAAPAGGPSGGQGGDVDGGASRSRAQPPASMSSQGLDVASAGLRGSGTGAEAVVASRSRPGSGGRGDTTPGMADRAAGVSKESRTAPSNKTFSVSACTWLKSQHAGREGGPSVRSSVNNVGAEQVLEGAGSRSALVRQNSAPTLPSLDGSSDQGSLLSDEQGATAALLMEARSTAQAADALAPSTPPLDDDGQVLGIKARLGSAPGAALGFGSMPNLGGGLLGAAEAVSGAPGELPHVLAHADAPQAAGLHFKAAPDAASVGEDAAGDAAAVGRRPQLGRWSASVVQPPALPTAASPRPSGEQQGGARRSVRVSVRRSSQAALAAGAPQQAPGVTSPAGGGAGQAPVA